MSEGIPSWPLYRILSKRLVDSYSGYHFATLQNIGGGPVFEDTTTVYTEDQIEFENGMLDLVAAGTITHNQAYDLIHKAHSGYQQRARYWVLTR